MDKSAAKGMFLLGATLFIGALVVALVWFLRVQELEASLEDYSKRLEIVERQGGGAVDTSALRTMVDRRFEERMPSLEGYARQNDLREIRDTCSANSSTITALRTTVQSKLDQAAVDARIITLRPLSGPSGGSSLEAEDVTRIVKSELGDLPKRVTFVEGKVADFDLNVRLRSLPAGTIVAWTKPGPLPDELRDWALCDGDNGTPNLQGRFLVGADARRNLLTSGGREDIPKAKRHRHYGSVPPAGENVSAKVPSAPLNARPEQVVHLFPYDTHDHEGDNLPPYVAVRFIMKVR